MLSKLFPSLSRLRFAVQLLMLFVTVYGSALVGPYMADKLSNALPALSCAYDQMNGGYCVLIPTQHILHHRIGEAIVRAQQLTFGMVLPLLMSLLAFFAFFFVLGKAFCGWVCPLGTVQEIVARLGRRFGVPLRRLDGEDLPAGRRARPFRWLLLLVLVFLLPLLTGLGITPHELGNPYCDLCPARVATTLLTGSGEQLALRPGDGWAFALNATADFLLGFILVGGLAIRQPFCRICPLLAFNSLFQRLSPLRLVKRRHDNCGQCRICSDACPLDIAEVATQDGGKAYSEDCTLCGRCVEFCPQDGTLQIKWGPVRLFGSSRRYYKLRIAGELPDGSVRPARPARPPEGGDDA